MLKVIIPGPESSGKTTLYNALIKRFNLSGAKEYAREYLNGLNRDYNQADLLKIAKGQFLAEQKAQILDTDLITIKIWSNYKYGNCDSWILSKINQQKSERRYYLLCTPDIPWRKDPQRENPNDRDILFKIYKKELDHLGCDYFIVNTENRIENAISKILTLKPFI